MSENNKENSETQTGKLDAELNNVIMNLTNSLMKKQDSESDPQAKKKENAVDMNALIQNTDLNSMMKKMTNLLMDETLKNSFKGLTEMSPPAPAESSVKASEKEEKADLEFLSEKLDTIMKDLSNIKEELTAVRKKQNAIIVLFEQMGWGRRKKD